MILKKIRNKWQFYFFIMVVSVAIPLLITTYELMTTEKDSVVFLGDYSPIVGYIVLAYYMLLLFLGVVWVVLRIHSTIKLKNEKIKNELIHLQSQVNPHFFFNTLNNLYGLVGKDTEKAKQLILKLSEMMRYSIYDGQKELVDISQEVVYLKSYIELHKMRYQKNIEVLFDVKVGDGNFRLIPLLFIILLENAFKHGVERLRANAYVHVKLVSTKSEACFEVENNFDEEELNGEAGIGLANLKRRLALVYPENHTLSFKQEKGVYKAKLILKQI